MPPYVGVHLQLLEVLSAKTGPSSSSPCSGAAPVPSPPESLGLNLTPNAQQGCKTVSPGGVSSVLCMLAG